MNPELANRLFAATPYFLLACLAGWVSAFLRANSAEKKLRQLAEQSVVNKNIARLRRLHLESLRNWLRNKTKEDTYHERAKDAYQSCLYLLASILDASSEELETANYVTGEKYHANPDESKPAE
jgi:hypothetical protein